MLSSLVERGSCCTIASGPMSSPHPILHSSERVLEFDQLRQLLSAYTASPLGQERVMQLTPSRDRLWIERQQQLTEELRGYLRTGGHFDFHGWYHRIAHGW